jgi:hypothetical protein
VKESTRLLFWVRGSIRAHRGAGIEKTRVFEVDYPATQEVKLKRLKKVIDPLPGYVVFIPIDFNTQMLAERLFTNGYNEQGKTLFIWQGVTMYLTPEGVDSTLAYYLDETQVTHFITLNGPRHAPPVSRNFAPIAAPHRHLLPLLLRFGNRFACRNVLETSSV